MTGSHLRVFASALIVAVLSLAATETLVAQNGAGHGRQGLWLGAGLGVGFARARCDLCTNNRDGGLSGHARVGGTITSGFLLGVEGDGWRHQNEGVDLGFGALHAVALWYPSPRGTPWFLKGGFGFVGYRVDGGADVEAITASSFGGQFGAGYDLRVTRNVSLTPQFTFVGSLFANLESEGQRLADVTLTLIQFGMGVTVH